MSLQHNETPSFTLFKREGRSSNFYVQFKLPTGERTTERSTGCADKTSALMKVAEWLRDGIPAPTRRGEKRSAPKARRAVTSQFDFESMLKFLRKAELSKAEAGQIVAILQERKLVEVQLRLPGPGDRDFVAFLTEFWDYRKSPYVQEKRSHGLRIGVRHCKSMGEAVLRHWKPAFAGRSLASIAKADLKAFSTSLAGRGLAGASVNKTLLAGTVALKWAKSNDLISVDPGEGLRKFSTQGHRRGIFTEAELSRLFQEGRWPEDGRARVAALLSITTGLRVSECRAVRLSDIEGGVLHVHAWKEAERRVAAPKNGEDRNVPILPAILAELRELAARNPHGEDGEGFVFFGIHPDAPCQPDVPLDGLEAALETIGVSREQRLTRGLCFHSFRHQHVATLSRSLEASTLKVTSGHKSMQAFDIYASHGMLRDVQRVAKAAQEAFGSILAKELDNGNEDAG